MVVKPRVLLCWGYQRRAWTQVFESLQEEFDFCYLYFRHRGEDDPTMACTDCPKFYWQDFDSACRLLQHVQPKLVIMMSVTSGLGIALNIASRNANIPCLVLQHGLVQEYVEYLHLEERNKGLTVASPKFTQRIEKVFEKMTTACFLIRSMAWFDWLQLPIIFRYLNLSNKSGFVSAGRTYRFPQRMPHHYICFSPKNGLIYRDIDLASQDRLHYVGIPEFDKFMFDAMIQEPQDYMLLIDQPYVSNQYHRSSVGPEDMNAIYSMLNEYAKSINCGLKIKLHPESYRDSWQVQHPNITYIRDADLGLLLGQAKGIFSCMSSLMLLAIYFRPTFLLIDENYRLQQEMISLGLARGAPIFDFSIEDIEFRELDRESPVFKDFVTTYFYRADGQSVRRLSQILRAFVDNGI